MTNVTDEGLARLVSSVTGTMLGMGCMVSSLRELEASPATRTVLITVGDGMLTIGLSCDRPGRELLCAALMAGTGMKVNEALMDDALRELANMTAGQIKRAMCPGQSLGLPRLLDGARPTPLQPSGGGGWRQVCLRAGKVEMVLWLTERKESKRESTR